MVSMDVRDEHSWDLGQNVVHRVSVVSAELPEGSLATVQQQRLTGAARREQSLLKEWNYKTAWNSTIHIIWRKKGDEEEGEGGLKKGGQEERTERGERKKRGEERERRDKEKVRRRRKKRSKRKKTTRRRRERSKWRKRTRRRRKRRRSMAFCLLDKYLNHFINTFTKHS